MVNAQRLQKRLSNTPRDNPPAYLDNACIPQTTIRHQQHPSLLHRNTGCGGRSVHRYGTAISKAVSDARTKLGAFLNAAHPINCLYSQCHHSINQIAHGCLGRRGRRAGKRTENQFELGALAPTEQEQGIDHRVVASNEDNTFDMEAFEAACRQEQKLKMSP